MSKAEKHQQRLEDQLSAGEVVIASITATATERGKTSGPTRGSLIVTNLRIVYSGSGAMRHQTRDMPLGQVASLNLNRGPMSAHIDVGVAGVSERFLVKYNDAVRWLEAAQQALTTYRVWAANQAGSHAIQKADPTASLSEELSKLAGLHTQGLLTDAEYSAAKARLLGA